MGTTCQKSKRYSLEMIFSPFSKMSNLMLAKIVQLSGCPSRIPIPVNLETASLFPKLSLKKEAKINFTPTIMGSMKNLPSRLRMNFFWNRILKLY